MDITSHITHSQSRSSVTVSVLMIPHTSVKRINLDRSLFRIWLALVRSDGRTTHRGIPQNRALRLNIPPHSRFMSSSLYSYPFPIALRLVSISLSKLRHLTVQLEWTHACPETSSQWRRDPLQAHKPPRRLTRHLPPKTSNTTSKDCAHPLIQKMAIYDIMIRCMRRRCPLHDTVTR